MSENDRVEITDQMYRIIDATGYFNVPARELPDNWLQFIAISFDRLTMRGWDYGSAMERIHEEMDKIIRGAEG